MPQRRTRTCRRAKPSSSARGPAPRRQVEPLVTRKIEQKIAENSNVEEVRSITRTSVSIVFVKLRGEREGPRKSSTTSS